MIFDGTSWMPILVFMHKAFRPGAKLQLSKSGFFVVIDLGKLAVSNE
jgi:hypothetical protein